MTVAAVSPERRFVLSRRIRLLVAATISYNVVEAVVALAAGTVASSIALVGFGQDSVIEVSSGRSGGVAVLRQESAAPGHIALRIIAGSFFALAAFVTIEAVRSLAGAEEAERSTVGIVVLAASVMIMPVLSWAQPRAGRELGSCPRLCCSALCSTPHSAGGGPIRSRR